MESPSSSTGSQPTANDNIRHFLAKRFKTKSRSILAILSKHINMRACIYRSPPRVTFSATTVTANTIAATNRAPVLCRK